MMTGISEALVATAAGIIVAVEAVIFYNYFQSRLSRIAVELKLMADEFVDLLRERGSSSSAPVSHTTETASTTTPSVAS